MRRLTTLLVMFASLTFAAGAAAELKVAVLDVQRALLSTQAAQAELEKINADLQNEQAAVRELTQELNKLQERMLKDGEVMSDQERRKLSGQIEDKRMDYQFQRSKLQKELEERQRTLMEDLAPKLDAALQELIEAEGYDMILPRQGVLWIRQTHDITGKVTEKLDASE